MAFRGWPAEAVAFYEGLEADNSRTYWAAHKEIYESAVVAPFRALSDEVANDFGPLHLFRPHRDVRFSKDKSPYKTAQGAVTESEGGAIYYVSLGPYGLFAGSGYYRPAPDQLARMREAIDDAKTGPAIERAVATARKGGVRDRRRVAEDCAEGLSEGSPAHRAAAHEGPHRRQGLAAGRSGCRPPRRRIASSIAWRASDPVNAWLAKHVGPSTAPPDDGWARRLELGLRDGLRPALDRERAQGERFLEHLIRGDDLRAITRLQGARR